MSFPRIATIAGVVAFASKVAAHGTVTGIVADGVYYPGYYPNFQYLATQPVVVGWSIPGDLNNGFIAPDAYTTSDIICHVGATNAQTSATVSAGGSVELQWTVWPESHHGPVIDYLANCNGDCTTVDKTTLEFFKIDGVGLIDDTTIPGSWASDTLIANNNSWTVTIPSDITPGNYVLRHEIIALHSAGSVDGAQNYPQCVNLEVTGSGTATPAGVLGTALYTETDPGIEINIYQSLSTYIVPGPTLYSGAISAIQTGGASAATASTSVSSVATSAPVSDVGKEVTSTAAGVVPPSISSVSAVPTSIKATSGAPYLNTTLSPTRSREPSTSSPSPKTSAISATTPVPVVGIVSTTEALTSPTETETLTVIPVPTTPVAPSDPATIPAGTKLSDLLSWIAAFYNKFKGTSYTDATIARRHARDVAARQEIEKYDGARFAATCTESGFARPTGPPHRKGFFGPGPTGVFPSGVPLPTEARHFVKAEFP